MIKPLFPLLLCYAFTTSQMFAISGGPVFGSGGISVTGLYAGVLQGVTESGGASDGPDIPGDTLPSPGDAGDAEASNAIGIFDLTVPSTSLGTGAFMLFADGTIFGGTIDVTGDPDSGEIKGLLQGQYDFSLNVLNGQGEVDQIDISAQARGRIEAQVSSSQALFSQSFGRLLGSATLSIDFGQINTSTLEPVVARIITFDVIGFKQANLLVG